jgi:hypothetical protein
MATYKEGNNTNTNSNNFNNYTHYSNTFSNSLPSIVRVTDIVLNENHNKFSEVGGWNGIGVIFFEDILNANKLYPGFAYPLNSQIKCYPLVNEIVFLKHASIKFLTPGRDELNFFYLPPTNVWNHPHHNAYPNMRNYNELNSDQKDDYDLVGNGVFIRRIDNLGTEIDLNSTNESQATFVEKKDIHPLLSFAGDTIYEGRYGQSLRFGSTSNCHLSEPKGNKKSSIENNWSNSGKNGNPITILRNGQPLNSSIEGWIPITENINKDLSSIYLTSYQKIPIEDTYWKSINSYTSNKPKSPSQYSNPQILLNSDRITINSKNDSILLRSQNSISLSSIISLNVDTPKTVIQSSNIFLGDAAAEERGIKGDTLKNKLDIILNSLILLTRVLEANQLWAGGLPSPDGGMLLTASNTKAQLQKELDSLNDILSKVVKTL